MTEGTSIRYAINGLETPFSQWVAKRLAKLALTKIDF